jgi:Tol biopolymer transport system component
MATEGAARNLYIRRLADLEPKLLRRADRYFELFVSHDGRWVAFNDESDYTLRKIDVNGGPPVEIARIGSELLGATWGDDDTIVYAVDAGLFRIPASGGTPVAVVKPDTSKGEFVFSWPVFLPGSKTVLYAARSGNATEWTINAVDLASGVVKNLVRGATTPLYSSTGHLLYVTDQALQSVAFDPVLAEIKGGRTTLLDGIMAKTSGSTNVAVAADGTLVYISGRGPGAKREVVWMDRDGKTESLGLPQRGYTSARLSPDGSRIALDILDDQSGVWLWDIARRGLTLLTSQDDRVSGLPTWTGDSKSIIFSSAREGAMNLFVQPADGTGSARRITTSPAGENMGTLTRDGKQVVFTRFGNSGTASDLLMAAVDGSTPAGLPLLTGKSSEINGELSPDGKWIAYESDESGLSQVYVRPFPNTEGGRWQISYDGGFQPMWSPNSDELFFTNTDSRLQGVRVTPGTSFGATAAAPIGNIALFASVVPRTFDISRDGKRFLVIRGIEESNWQAAVTVVQNWTQELKR